MEIAVGSVTCPRLNSKEIPIGKCRACKFHLDVIRGNVICDYP